MIGLMSKALRDLLAQSPLEPAEDPELGRVRQGGV
jgi:hypothetical protein